MSKQLSKIKPILKFAIRGLLLGAALIGGAYSILEGPQFHYNYIRNKVGPSVVMITNLDQNSGGTGFSVQSPNGKNFILTNAHVCLGVKRPLIITFADNRQVPLRIIEVSRKTDLCLIESVGNLPGLKLGSGLDIGESLAIVGHPALMSLTLSKGDLIEFLDVAIPVPQSICDAAVELGGPFVPVDDIYYTCAGFIKGVGQTNAEILGGSSGSPVVNFFGNIVGIAFAGRNGDGSNWALIIPVSHIREFLKPY